MERDALYIAQQAKCIRTASEFLAAFGQREAYRIDMSAIPDDAALETAAAMGDWIRDMGDIWEECYMSHRLEYPREFAAAPQGRCRGATKSAPSRWLDKFHSSLSGYALPT